MFSVKQFGFRQDTLAPMIFVLRWKYRNVMIGSPYLTE